MSGQAWASPAHPRVWGVVGYSGSGKTTLIEKLVRRLTDQGETVAVIKHAHHSFDVDQPGKDSDRFRKAGAREVLLASRQRRALMRESPTEEEPDLRDLLRRLEPADWVLVEGFKGDSHPKVEVWRTDSGVPPLDENQAGSVLAWVSDAPQAPGSPLPEGPQRTVFPLGDVDALLAWMRANAAPGKPSNPHPTLRSLDDMQQELLSTVFLDPDEGETLAVSASTGRVLAKSITSPLNMPAFDHSAMDGYALQTGDFLNGLPQAPVAISLTVRAGDPPGTLPSASVARILTGAPLPQGANAVIPQEKVSITGAGVSWSEPPAPGQWIRRRGEDLKEGEPVLLEGTLLGPASMGLLASLGLTHIQVRRSLRVGLLSTGSELTPPGQALKPGTIYDANSSLLKGLIESSGAQCVDLGTVPDRLDRTCEALLEATRSCDVLITSGGVSVGDEDHLKTALAQVGQLRAWALAIKPGKPLAFGQVPKPGAAPDKAPMWVLGLPGNPVSAWVTFLLLVHPVLQQLQGKEGPRLPRAQWMQAGFDRDRPDARREFIRVKVGADGRLQAYPNQSSGALTSVQWADGLVDVAPGLTFQKGAWVPFLPFRAWGL